MKAQRRAREAAHARRMILEAAAAVFARKGFHGATLDEIARTAGYSPPALYRYFRNKDEIFHGVMTTIGEQFLSLFDERPPVPLRFADRLRWHLARQFQIAQQHRDLFVTFIAQRAVFEWDLRSEIGEAAHQFYVDHLRRLADLMREGVAEGALRQGDPDDYATAFAAIVRGFVFRWLIAERAYPLERHIETIVALFLRGAGRQTDA